MARWRGAHFYRCLFAKNQQMGAGFRLPLFPENTSGEKPPEAKTGNGTRPLDGWCPEVTSGICLPRSRLKNDSPNSAARRHCVVLSNNPLMKTKRRPPFRSVKETSSLLLRLLPVFLHGDCRPFRGIMLNLCDNDRHVVMNFPGAGTNHFLEN